MSNYKQDALDYSEQHLQTAAAAAIIQKIKNWVTIDPDRASKRWPFELIQNALDAAPCDDKEVLVEIERRNDKGIEKLVFRHNAGPFTHKEIFGLIHGGSTKRSAFNSEPLYIGQFGTGFLISHILSRKVRLVGIGLDKEGLSHEIDIFIDRTSDNEEFTVAQIRQCILGLDTPEFDKETTNDRPFAEYTYYLDSPQSIEAAEVGIKTLKSLAPWILAVNPKLAEVKLPGTIFTRQTKHLENNIDLITILENGSKTPIDILLYTNNSVSIGIQTKDKDVALLPEELPRLFISMPLIGSESIPLPFIVSSPKLKPGEERDILPFAGGDEAVNNKSILGEAFNVFYALSQYCANNKYGGLHNLCSFSPVSNDTLKTNSVYWGYWKTEIQKSVNVLAKLPLVITDNGHKTPVEVIFPTTKIDLYSRDVLDQAQFEKFFDVIHTLRKPLPKKEIAYDWQTIMEFWKVVDPSISLNLTSLQDLHKYITGKCYFNNTFQKLDSVARNLDISPQQFENVFIEIYNLADGLYKVKKIKEDFIDGLLLTQDNMIRNKDVDITDAYQKIEKYLLHREDEEDPIPAELKDISGNIAFSLRRILVDVRFSKYAITQAFIKDQIYVEKVLGILLTAKYKPPVKSKVDFTNRNHLAWVKLLTWCLLNEQECNGFPVFSKDSQVTIWNRTDINTLHILPFGRIGVKEEFEELIPDSRVLNNIYFTLLTSDQAALLQKHLIEKGMCVGEVVAKTSTCKLSADRLMSILSKGEPMPDDKYHKFTSVGPLISSIYFHDQIIGSASQIPARAKLFLRFLVEVICQKDSAWRTETTVSCDCEKNHKIVPAEWLAKVKCDSWVPVRVAEEIKQREATKESIDKLMGDDGIRKIVLSQFGVGLLEHLRYDRLDLSIKKRSYEPGSGHDEKQIKDTLSVILDNSLDVNMILNLIKERESRVVPKPKETLSQIYDWWHKEKTPRLTKYNEQTYDRGKIPNITLEPGQEKSVSWREEWLKLFLTSILQTMGRQTRQQHREFVKRCCEMGLLHTMAENRPWLDVVTKRFKTMDSDVEEYFKWFEKTIGLHLIAVNLNDYALLYSSQINRFQNIKLEDLTMPGFSVELQGGGLDLPPVRKIFGRGINFMLRELARPEMEIITRKEVFPYCYVGSLRVRRLLKLYLGFQDIEDQPNQSFLIHKELVAKIGEDKAHFERSFDIPLEIISEDDALMTEFFGKGASTFTEDDDKDYT